MLPSRATRFGLLLIAALGACEAPERRSEGEPTLVHAEDGEEAEAPSPAPATEPETAAKTDADPRREAMKSWPLWEAQNASPPLEVLKDCEQLQEQALAAGGGELTEKLCFWLRQDSSRSAPYLAWILGPVPGARVFAALAWAAERSEFPALQRSACRALAQRSELEAGLALRLPLTQSAAAEAAAASAEVLARLDTQRIGVEESLLKALADPQLQRGARPFLLRAIVRLRLTAAGALLARNLEALNIEEAVLEIQALSSLGGGVALDALRAHSQHSQAAIRAASLRALAELGDSLSRDSFREACRDPAAEVRVAAVAALTRIQDLGAGAEVARALEDPEQAVRIEACRAAGVLKMVSCAETLTRLCERGGSLAQRCQALEALSDLKLGHRDGLDFCREASRSSEPGSLSLAIAALRATLAKRRFRAAAVLEVLESFPQSAVEMLWEALLVDLRRRRDWREEERSLVDEALRRSAQWPGRADLKILALVVGREAQVGVSAADLIRSGDALINDLKSREPKVLQASTPALRILGGALVCEDLELALAADKAAKVDAAIEAIEQWWDWQRQRLSEDP